MTGSITDIDIDIRDPSIYQLPLGASAHNYSKLLDKEIGFRIPQIEQALLKSFRAYNKGVDPQNKKTHYGEAQAWIGLPSEALQTPYSVLSEALQVFKTSSGEKKFKLKDVVDLGAGYGRLGFVLHSLFPDCSFTGYEILKERSDEANRIYNKLELKNAHIINKNIALGETEIKNADLYFIYDFSEVDQIILVIDKILANHKDIRRPFFLLVRGERIKSTIMHEFSIFWKGKKSIQTKDWSLFFNPSK